MSVASCGSVDLHDLHPLNPPLERKPHLADAATPASKKDPDYSGLALKSPPSRFLIFAFLPANHVLQTGLEVSTPSYRLRAHILTYRASKPGITSGEIEWICLQNPIPILWRIYGVFWLCKCCALRVQASAAACLAGCYVLDELGITG